MEGILPLLPDAEGTLKVPYLAPPLYHGPNISFYDFPQQIQFSKTDDAASLASDCKDIKTMTFFLQSWLFFELLSTFLGIPIARADFVVNGAIELGQDTVHNYFKRWKLGLSKLPNAQRHQRRENVNKLINFALLKCEIFEDAADILGEGDEIFDSVALSVKLLLSLLSLISEDTFTSLHSPWREYWALQIPFVFGFENRSLDRTIIEIDKKEALQHLTRQPKILLPLPPGENDGGRATKLLLRRFSDNGWCRSRARQLCQSHDFLSANNLASMCLKQVGSSAQLHQGCKKMENCVAHWIDESAYPFRHVEDPVCNGHCDFMTVNKAEVNEIIRSGGIPIISMGFGKNDLDLKVERCTPQMTYTAISHVWSDGLGNPHGNSIYRCQLVRLRAMILQNSIPEYSPLYRGGSFWSRFKSRYSWSKRLSSRPGKPSTAGFKDRIYFWMDTLCTPRSAKPRNPETYGSLSEYERCVSEYKDDEHLRKLSLQHITPTYAGADTVLVLDRALQTMDPASATQLNGDKFAALVLSTNWMQRGWTLEEGSLAQNCVFRLMGRPYEMSSSLQHSLTPLKWQNSPFDRAISKAQQMAPSFMRRALMDDKRQLTKDGKIMRIKFLKRELRIPQFVTTWNSIQERSTTRPTDRLILFANLLDFNVYSLEALPEDEKLPSLIQSCDELPLSLLYNTGTRFHIDAHPELGWMPMEISDVRLVGGAVIRRTYPWRCRDRVCYRIDRANLDPDSIMFLKTIPTDLIPRTVDVFAIQRQENGDNGITQEYYVEIQRSDTGGSNSDVAHRIAQTKYSQSQGTFIVIDLSCGNTSSRGFAGRGARFSISEVSQKEMSLKFDNPLIAYTPEQWQRKFKAACPATLLYDMQEVDSRQRLLLKYDASLWRRKLARRPLLTQHPISAWLVSLIIFLVAFLLLVFFCVIFLDISSILILRLTFVVSVGVALIPNRFMAMYTYKSWLKSFEEKWAGNSAQANLMVRSSRLARNFWGLFGGRASAYDLRFWRRRRGEPTLVSQGSGEFHLAGAL